MKHFIASMLIIVAAALPAQAQDTRVDAVVGTIQNQLDAFQVDDFATAFTYASPNIKRLFGNPARFGQMVRNGFPMVWRPSEVQFLEFKDQAGQVSQLVLFRDANGVPIVLEYFMVETEQGWQIDGVQPVQAPDVAA
ncbi:MAG: DUF4864 domain-containing protein [Pseudomonadota bacterium]